MNALLVVVLFVFFGGLICFAIGRLAEDAIRELWPDCFATSTPRYQVIEHARIPRVKFIPKRSPVSKPLGVQEKSVVVRPAIATAIIIGLLFSNFSNGQGLCAVTHGTSHFTATQFMDGVRLKFWPVWGRSGNDNIISREKIFGQEIASKEPVLKRFLRSYGLYGFEPETSGLLNIQCRSLEVRHDS
jgi:hypothetical protein